MSVNLLGILDDSVAKFKNMVVMTSLIAFINYAVDNGLQPKIEDAVNWIKENTGFDIDSSYLEFALDFALNQLNLFIIFTITESSEDLVRNMLDNPSAIRSAMRRFV